MTELESRYVKRGLWTNLNEGTIMGQTITTDAQTGNIVIAVLAVFSSLGITHLWRLLIFCYHQHRADGEARDAFFQQQQAILRTLSPPSDMLASFSKVWWSWRYKTRAPFLRSLPLILLALLCAVASIATSISAAYVVSSSHIEVLVSSPFCASPFPRNRYTYSMMSAVAAYTRDCYSAPTTVSTRCDSIFTKPSIPLMTTRSTCPFNPRLCRLDENDRAAVTIDSGLLDVGTVFGLNIPNSDRVRFRRKTTCAILPSRGHSFVINATWVKIVHHLGRPLYPGEELLGMLYGKSASSGLWNVTHSVLLSDLNATINYGINGFTYFASPARRVEGDSWIPLAEMTRDDADINLEFIEKGRILYSSPVSDPLFSATKPKTVKLSTGGKGVHNQTFYLSDEPVTAVSCITQHQFCHSDWCSDLREIPGNITETFPGASKIQLAILDLLVNATLINTIRDHASVAASSILDDAGGTGFLDYLPDDQWITEARNWEASVWAALQVYITDHAVGYSVRALTTEDTAKNNRVAGQPILCNLQKMRKSGGFVNINVFGLVFILVFSCAVIIIDILLLRFLIYVSKFRSLLAPRIDRWIQNGILQLQRRAFEGEGKGTWTRLNKEVPIENDKTLFEDFVDRTSRPQEPVQPELPEQLSTPDSVKSKTASAEQVQDDVQSGDQSSQQKLKVESESETKIAPQPETMTPNQQEN